MVLGSESESGGGNPAIAPDESFLIFSDEREAGHGGSDLYVSFHRDGAWTAPSNLGEPVNSAFADFAPAVSWDGAHLFWTSERPGIVPAGGVEGRPPEIFIEPSGMPSLPTSDSSGVLAPQKLELAARLPGPTHPH